MPSRMIETYTSSRASAAPTMPGSRCRSGRIALKRWVTLRAPASNAAFACAAVASLWPSETATPRSSSRSISSPAPGELRARASSAAPGRRRAAARAAAGRGRAVTTPRGCRAGSARGTALRGACRGSAAARLVDRHLAHRGEHLLLRARDQRREVRRHAGLEQRVARRGGSRRRPRRGSRRRRSRSPAGRRSPGPRSRGRACRRGRRPRSGRRRPRRRPRRAPRRQRCFDSEPSRHRASLEAVRCFGQYQFRQLCRETACLRPSWSIPSHADGGDQARPGDQGVRRASRPSTTSRSRSRDGEFLVLVGPSGCGKSTLLRHDRRARGRDRRRRSAIGDRDVTDLAPQVARHRHGLPDLRALPAHDRAPEPRLRAARRGGRRRPRSRAASTRSPSCSGLADLLDRRPAQLSGGQRQRVAMGRAIVARSRRRSCSTSRSPTSTRSCASACARRSRSCTSGSASRPSTSRTTRPRR